MLCQIIADGRIRKESKTLMFKPRFVEEVLASHSKTTCSSFASKHILFLVALTCSRYSCTLFHSIHPLQFKSHFHYNRFLFSSSPLFLMLSNNKFNIFFCFSPCSVRLSQQKFPVLSITAGMWGQSYSASLKGWTMAYSVQMNFSRNANSKNRNIFRTNFHTSTTPKNSNTHDRKTTFQEVRRFVKQNENLFPHNLALENDLSIRD